MTAEIDWMGGAVPPSWQVYKLKYVLREEHKSVGEDLPAGAISFGEVVYKDFDNEETLATYRTVRRGQFLINPLNLNYDLKSLRIGLSEIDCRVSPAYIVASADESISNASYLRWALRVFDVQHIKTLGAGVRQTVKFEDIGACRIALPSLDQQEVIASRLSSETSRIDALVAKKTRFIELLREKRQALITQAVTKGLDPSVPMKDSGVEWLGEVPAHWIVGAVRRFHSLNPSKREIHSRDRHEQVTFLPMEAIGETGSIDLNRTRAISDVETGYSYFADGDVVIAKITPCFENGKGAAIKGLIGGVGFGTTELIVLRPSPQISQQYSWWLFAATGFRRFAEGHMEGSAGQKRVQDEWLKAQKIALPPRNEQDAIVSHLDRATGRIDTLIDKTERSIELLREHRNALITAAVTGKIDLRNAA